MIDYSKASTNSAAGSKMIHSFSPRRQQWCFICKIPNMGEGGSWRVVQKFAHMHLWNVDETSIDEIPKGVTLSYQDDECVASNIQHTEVNLNNVTSRVEDEVILDASVVQDLHIQREVEGEQNCYENEEDETGRQYAGDNDEHTIPNDVYDDSNYD
jgi:hypothetical protein